MDSDRKEEALHSILKPNMSQQNTYSDIDEYYSYYIHDIMEVSKKNVRSDYNLRVDISYDKNEQKICAKGTAIYRLYPSENGYVPIQLGIDKDGLSKCLRLDIFDDNGKISKIPVADLQYDINESNQMRISTIQLNNYTSSKHLTIEIDFIEYGYDHWMAFKFLIFQPTDGLNLEIKCFDDISLKEKNIYDISSKYHISIDNDEHYKVSSHQWIQEGSGFMMIASKPEECDLCAEGKSEN